ncbi:putative alpha-1,2-mannosidase [Algoriphagus iocasae]|uniref:Putative alpha-1,2-mannosidase n=1 Tax=Algoriphagus iocasae TaxID=1836499 RepID=A0A841MKN3_9BACT|nr:glycoside hydrolase domain-containing protein [Algoriphagus iocasae]MBB6328000.1 putative alpha-1,2-mannosidase [Algoriphagus iocasae]
MEILSANGGTEANASYEIGSSNFDEIRIKLNPDYYPSGNFVINALNNGENKVYVKSAIFNKKTLDEFNLRHDQIIQGRELVLQMSNQY